MAKPSQQEIDFIRLILRSADVGDGWRQCSKMIWPWVEKFTLPELLEQDAETLKVRLSARGQIMKDYI